MHKKGASFDEHSMFFLIVVGALMVVSMFAVADQGITGITGAAVVKFDKQTIFSEVQSLVQQFPLTKYAGSGAEMCLLIDAGSNHVFSFDIFKSGSRVSVSESKFSRYCSNDHNNQGAEDFVVKYNSYAAFKKHLEEPTCKQLKRLVKAQKMVYLSSEFVEQGGMPVCNRVFRDRYCHAFTKCFGFHELPAMGLDCCIEQSPKDTFALGTRELSAIIAALVILTLLTIMVVVHIHHKHRDQDSADAKFYSKEVRDFLTAGQHQGYTKKELEHKLLDKGWEESFVDPIVKRKK